MDTAILAVGLLFIVAWQWFWYSRLDKGEWDPDDAALKGGGE